MLPALRGVGGEPCGSPDGLDPEEAPAGGEPQVFLPHEELTDEERVLGLVDIREERLHRPELGLVVPHRGRGVTQPLEEVAPAVTHVVDEVHQICGTLGRELLGATTW